MIDDNTPQAIAQQKTMFAEIVRKIIAADLDKFGSGDEYAYGVTDDRQRGKIFDVVRKQIPAA